jgi:hypothetical protein
MSTYTDWRSPADYLHGDEELSDSGEYAPMQQWEIDEALADIIGDDKWLEERSE